MKQRVAAGWLSVGWLHHSSGKELGDGAGRNFFHKKREGKTLRERPLKVKERETFMERGREKEYGKNVRGERERERESA